MIRSMIAAFAFVASTATAMAGMITVDSAHDVKTTIDRLEAAARKGGATIFTRIDHQANAKGIGMEMPPSQVLIFGNPKGGTPLMLANPEIGLDLPLRVHAFEKDGKVVMMYHDPVADAKAHGLDPTMKPVQGAAGALKKLTGIAGGN